MVGKISKKVKNMGLNENIIPNCCNDKPKYIVSYKVGSHFFVCESCIMLDHWSRGIKSKEELN